MYRVLIIDDEKTIVQGLRVFIDWEKYGFEIAGEAFNGQTGVEMAQKLDPHLIITDIRMPLLSGLDVIDKVKVFNADCKFIILSGFSDFEYALDAINKGVCCYLLKPIQENELLEVILLIKEELDKKDYKKKEEEKLKRQLRESLPLLRERYLNEIVNGEGLSCDEIVKRWKYLNINYSLNKFCILIVDVDDVKEKYKENIEDGLIMKFAVNNIIEELLDSIKGGITFNHSNGNLIILYSESESNTVDDGSVYKIVNRIQKCIEKYIDETVTISVGGIYNDISKLSVSYSEAKKALEYKIIYGNNSFISIDDIQASENYFSVPIELEKRLITHVQIGNKEESMDALNEIFDYIKKSPACKPESFYGVCADIIVLVTRHISSYGSDAQNLLCGDEFSLKTLFNVKTENALKANMRRILMNSIDMVNRVRINKMKGTMGKIKEYIECYYNQEITLDLLANKFFMSPNYLSQIFRKELGITFVDFLTRTRLENAKKLLMDPELKIYEVSSMVGYTNQRYFSQVFEKYSGHTPSEYRKIEGHFIEDT